MSKTRHILTYVIDPCRLEYLIQAVKVATPDGRTELPPAELWIEPDQSNRLRLIVATDAMGPRGARELFNGINEKLLLAGIHVVSKFFEQQPIADDERPQNITAVA